MTNPQPNPKAALARLEKTLSDLTKSRRPLTRSAYDTLEMPLVRRSREGAQCEIVGKLYSWTADYLDVALLVGNDLDFIKVKKSTAHLTPCRNCPDYRR